VKPGIPSTPKAVEGGLLPVSTLLYLLGRDRCVRSPADLGLYQLAAAVCRVP
jgi:hypothetical protein